MLLHDYLCRYNQTHDIRPSTLAHYHWVVRSIESHRGCLDLSALTGPAVSDWLTWLAARGRSPWTIKQRRISLLVLWRAAWEDGLAPALQPVKRLRPLHHSPTAWTVAEVRLLVRAADSRGPWWSSLVRATYDTGLRIGDVLSLRAEQLGAVLGISQTKTGLPVLVSLRPATLRAIRRQLAGRTTGPIWPWPYRRECLYEHFRRLVTSAGIRPGTSRWLRRSAATACESVKPGSGTVLLGHASRATTEAWYIDRSQLARPPLPPL